MNYASVNNEYSDDIKNLKTRANYFAISSSFLLMYFFNDEQKFHYSIHIVNKLQCLRDAANLAIIIQLYKKISNMNTIKIRRSLKYFDR